MILRRTLALAAVAAAVALGSCGKPAETKKTDTLTFAILPAENQQSMGSVWEPLIKDMAQQTGLKIETKYVQNYTALIEAMRFNQVQAGWLSALPALEAVNRSDGEVIGRIISGDGSLGYNSVLIVRAGSGITLDDVLKCGKRYTFGIGDAKSTSGTLAPMYYLFTPKGINPADCFKVVRSASHQANMGSVANGLLEVATNNTEGLLFARRESEQRGEHPNIADKVKVIWTSPPLPESGIVVRKDVDPAIKAKMRAFFTNYGTAPGPQGDHEREVLKGLTYKGFKATDDSYLDPIRGMLAANALAEAKRGGDAAKIAAAQKDFDAVQAKIASHPADAGAAQ